MSRKLNNTLSRGINNNIIIKDKRYWLNNNDLIIKISKKWIRLCDPCEVSQACGRKGACGRNIEMHDHQNE